METVEVAAFVSDMVIVCHATFTSFRCTYFTQKLKYMQFEIPMQCIQCNLQQSGRVRKARSALTTAPYKEKN